MPAGDSIQGIGQAARNKRRTNFYLFSAIPPIGAAGIEDILGSRFGWLLAAFVRFLDLYVAIQAFFFSSTGSWAGCVSDSLD